MKNSAKAFLKVADKLYVTSEATQMQKFHAVQANNGAYTLVYEVNGIEKEWKFQFTTENAALLFATMNRKLLK